jgi:lipopolysaccharide transport system permease protein
MRSEALSDLAAYGTQVLRYRHFWVHLALSDLRARFRRSYLGILWIALQPLLLTIMMSMVFIFVFHQSFADYSVYLFSGMIIWEFITGCFQIGATSYITAEGYVRQIRLPMIIYPLKALLYCCIVFSLTMSGFVFYALAVKPEIFTWRWIYLAPFFIMLVIFGAPLTVISAITNIKFRDFQQSITLGLQMLLYVSPVMFVRSVFDHPGLREWTKINPIAALMDIARDPLINGVDPVLSNFGIIVLWSLGLWAIAILMLVRNERKIVFFY